MFDRPSDRVVLHDAPWHDHHASPGRLRTRGRLCDLENVNNSRKVDMCVALTSSESDSLDSIRKHT